MPPHNLTLFLDEIQRNHVPIPARDVIIPSTNEILLTHYGIFGFILFYIGFGLVIFTLLYLTAANLEKTLDINIIEEIQNGIKQSREAFTFNEKNK
jgi:hypothetical protein